ncbi:hypothetical protein AWZ03_010378 [Drosophila navojoa]|uniref:Ig-like domain-containing protein n=1 Tax=Drosophila navojoa TaxID=7232 RepID=A0A484B3F8_DRONA|nr:hypothetical protein AWZ03_010378 [Drosophila navojoa]
MTSKASTSGLGSKVTDWGVEQCRSLHIHIKSPPRLRVDPASVTLQRGDSLRVRCLSPGNDDIKRYAQLGYSWTRNGVLFQSDAATAMWEDLYPDGSILKINNIQKSAEYACLVSNSVRPVSRSVYINVIERNAVHVCLAESSFGVHWPTSAPGAPIITDCPRGFEGHSHRICEQRDNAGNSSWLLPDFSSCVRDELLLIYNRFRALSAGFQQTNSSNILKACFEYTLQRRQSFLPGEASFLIDMLHELDTYLQLKGTQLEREMAAEIILRILDKVMQNAQSLNSQQLTEPQNNKHCRFLAAGHRQRAKQPTPYSDDGDDDDKKVCFPSGLNAQPVSLVDLFSDQLYMDIGLSTRLLHIMANSTIFASVISYKNLKSFLPKTYYTRGSDPKDSDYVLASRIIQTWLFQSNRSNDNFREPLDLSFEAGHVEIIFQHESVPKAGDWVAVCGHDYKASFDSTWRSDLCITKHLMENITRCICPLSGTYVVMLTKRQPHSSQSHTPQRPIFVIVSCALCLLQCCCAFLILLPIWCNRKCAVTFLKMQFCISTSSVMLIYLLGFMKMLPENWHAIISSSLASLLLLGISTLIAIALVIHTELVPKKYLQIGSKPPTPTKQAAASKRRESLSNITQISSAQSPEANGSSCSRSRSRSQSRNHPPPSRGRSAAGSSLPLSSGSAGIRGAIGISWLLPLLFAIAAPLICSIIGKWPRHWWPELVWRGGRQQPTDAAGEEYGEDGGVYYATHTLLNADNLLLESEALLGNATGRRQTAPTLAEPSANALATSASSITVGSEANLAAVTAAALTWPQQQEQGQRQQEKQPSVGWITPGHAAAFTSGTSATPSPSPSPSLSFILFVCIDLLFILLFCALFVILMKKLLWLWHKNRNVHAHPLDKFNMALRRRLGLLYRAGGLLLVKLCTDGCFIVYVNSTPDTLWAYPFGISCIILANDILGTFGDEN